MCFRCGLKLKAKLRLRSMQAILFLFVSSFSFHFSFIFWISLSHSLNLCVCVCVCFMRLVWICVCFHVYLFVSFLLHDLGNWIRRDLMVQKSIGAVLTYLDFHPKQWHCTFSGNTDKDLWTVFKPLFIWHTQANSSYFVHLCCTWFFMILNCFFHPFNNGTI